MNYTIVGDSMNISHHLEEQGRALPDPNPAVTILLSQATHDAAGIQGRKFKCLQLWIRGSPLRYARR